MSRKSSAPILQLSLSLPFSSENNVIITRPNNIEQTRKGLLIKMPSIKNRWPRTHPTLANDSQRSEWMRSVKLEGAIKPINTLLWLQAVRTIHILINGRRIDVGSPGAFDFFSSFFLRSLLIVVVVSRRGSSRKKRHKKKNCLFINNADKKTTALCLTADTLTGKIVLDFMQATATRTHLSLIRALTNLSLFCSRPKKKYSELKNSFVWGKHGRNERNSWVWRICEQRNISLLHFHFTCGFFVCVRCYLPSPGSAQHSVTASTVITAGGGGGCCRLAETSLSMVSLHFRCLCRCSQSHSFPIHATHTRTIFSFFLFRTLLSLVVEIRLKVYFNCSTSFPHKHWRMAQKSSSFFPSSSPVLVFAQRKKAYNNIFA